MQTYIKRFTINLIVLLMFAAPSMANDSAKIPAPDNKLPSREHYVAGGITGSLLGFGIGHAIQGRYKEKGWIFTVADTLALGTIIGGAAAATTKMGTGVVRSGDPKMKDALPFVGITALGAALYTGFRIWEIVDLWSADFSKDGN